ncbi:MAG: hypothetical protein WCY32_15175 [Burkholderiaceae bacterium]
MILDGAYIELIGFEAGVSPEIRPELQAQAAGLAATRAPEAPARLSVQLPPPAACELVFVQRS